jgi:hypothetical protein
VSIGGLESENATTFGGAESVGVAGFGNKAGFRHCSIGGEESVTDGVIDIISFDSDKLTGSTVTGGGSNDRSSEVEKDSIADGVGDMMLLGFKGPPGSVVIKEGFVDCSFEGEKDIVSPTVGANSG